jgi:hypothetical protein
LIPRREWVRAKDNRYKIETEMPSLALVFISFIGPNKELQKQFKHLLKK